MLRSVYLGSAVVPDGYNGHTCTLHFVYVPADRLTYAVHSSGHYRVSYEPHSIEEAPDIIRRRYPNARRLSLIGYAVMTADEWRRHPRDYKGRLEIARGGLPAGARVAMMPDPEMGATCLVPVVLREELDRDRRPADRGRA